jgi:hypothetical protein
MTEVAASKNGGWIVHRRGMKRMTGSASVVYESDVNTITGAGPVPANTVFMNLVAESGERRGQREHEPPAGRHREGRSQAAGGREPVRPPRPSDGCPLVVADHGRMPGVAVRDTRAGRARY